MPHNLTTFVRLKAVRSLPRLQQFELGGGALVFGEGFAVGGEALFEVVFGGCLVAGDEALGAGVEVGFTPS